MRQRKMIYIKMMMINDKYSEQNRSSNSSVMTHNFFVKFNVNKPIW